MFSSSESAGLGHPLIITTSMASPKVAAGKVWGNTGQTLCTKSCKGEHLLRYHELSELILKFNCRGSSEESLVWVRGEG